jgi:hypothetical protein
MGIGANSYGTVAKVEALTTRWTDGGTYKTTTQPTLVQVEGFIDDVSALVNTVLAQNGFTIPVSATTAPIANAALGLFVVMQAVALCDAAHYAGRFYQAEEKARGPWDVITEAAERFIEKYSQGLEDLAAARTRDLATAWMGQKPVAAP